MADDRTEIDEHHKATESLRTRNWCDWHALRASWAFHTATTSHSGTAAQTGSSPSSWSVTQRSMYSTNSEMGSASTSAGEKPSAVKAS